MWEINNTVQAVDFLRAIIFGIIICAVYGIFAALRKNGFNSTLAVFLQDIIFLLLVSPFIFLFLLATTNGESRLYVVVGIIFGFFVFKTIFFNIYVYLISKFLSFIAAIIRQNKKIGIICIGFFNKTAKKLKKFKKAANSLKKGLKKA